MQARVAKTQSAHSSPQIRKADTEAWEHVTAALLERCDAETHGREVTRWQRFLGLGNSISRIFGCVANCGDSSCLEGERLELSPRHFGECALENDCANTFVTFHGSVLGASWQ